MNTSFTQQVIIYHSLRQGAPSQVLLVATDAGFLPGRLTAPRGLLMTGLPTTQAAGGRISRWQEGLSSEVSIKREQS